MFSLKHPFGVPVSRHWMPPTAGISCSLLSSVVFGFKLLSSISYPSIVQPVLGHLHHPFKCFVALTQTVLAS